MAGPGMEIGAIYATIEARGFAKMAAQIASVNGLLKNTANLMSHIGGGRGGGGGGGGPGGPLPPKPPAQGLFPTHIQSTIDQLTRMRRPITVMQRDFARLGGEMTGGMQLLGNVFQHAIGRQMEPQLKVLQKDMVTHIAQLRGWGPATTLAMRGLVSMHTELGRFSKMTEFATKLIEPFARIARVGFYTLTGAVMGFVTAGLRGTVQGEMLSFRFGMLARSIGSIFLPIINEVIDWLDKLTNWFMSLSGEQQANIRKWILWTGGILGAIALLPTLIKIVGAVVFVVKDLGAALSFTMSSPAALGIMLLIGLTADLTDNFKFARNAAGELIDDLSDSGIGTELHRWAGNLADFLNPFGGPLEKKSVIDARKKAAGQGRDDLTLKSTGFESLTSSFNRIQTSALKTDYAKTTSENTEKIAELVQAILQNIAGAAPPLQFGK